LANTTNLGQLQELDLWGNQLSRSSQEAFSQSPALNNLVLLDLGISDEEDEDDIF